ncbi:MAG: DeoR/GlpR family DNA-binding transcription regulator [Lachnospiraceae bacterium]|nr:DeoR/GlpR family DNA-binding transcription regulator [Lachnospiraceae bacterium]
MLTEERWKAILEILEKEGVVSAQELSERLKVSASTVRRDLTQLDGLGRLVKVHGGATVVDTQYMTQDMSMEVKYGLYREEKKAIGTYAARLVSPKDFVFIDAGTTTEMLVDSLDEKRAIYMTNSMIHARKLSRKGCRVYLPGGEVKQLTEAIIGGEAADMIRNFHFTIGFFGTNGVNIECGFTTPDPQEALIKRISLEHSKKAYVLCDRSKFNVAAAVSFAGFTDAAVITDRVPDRKYKKYETIVEVMK